MADPKSKAPSAGQAPGKNKKKPPLMPIIGVALILTGILWLVYSVMTDTSADAKKKPGTRGK